MKEKHSIHESLSVFVVLSSSSPVKPLYKPACDFRVMLGLVKGLKLGAMSRGSMV